MDFARRPLRGSRLPWAPQVPQATTGGALPDLAACRGDLHVCSMASCIGGARLSAGEEQSVTLHAKHLITRSERAGTQLRDCQVLSETGFQAEGIPELLCRPDYCMPNPVHHIWADVHPSSHLRENNVGAVLLQAASLSACRHMQQHPADNSISQITSTAN